MSDRSAPDRLARQQAIDPRRSLIVQAPAGSGKTSLLTQRFLGLLAQVARPEEIVAITFTRKAAAEMRHRVVAALGLARGPLPPGAGEHEHETRRLALAALHNAEQRGWELDRHPSRLHIQTIDGLNHWLARRLPFSARLGIGPQLLDDARPAHAEAARRFVTRLEEGGPLAASIGRLVRLTHHDAGRLQPLLADMLARRELWLPKVLELAACRNPRREMEGFLQAAVVAELARIRSSLAGPLATEIVATLAEAAATAGPDSPLSPLAGSTDLPAAALAARGQWQCLAQALLTTSGSARRTLNRNHGFPPALKSLKARMTRLLERLTEAPQELVALNRLRLLPPDRYSDEQWERVAALCDSLVPAAAELQAVFAERGQLDHAAVAAAAREALGAPDSPSELALALEYRIRHILVDEYQDTSPVQQALLARLVAGWQPGDGHSLFCVGDPMQSIYGFREADVTLFLEAQARGIGDVALGRLALERNFRSCRSLVDWVNATFSRLLPGREDYERGAVCYSASDATRADEPGAGAELHALIGRDVRREARLVADLVERSLAPIPEPGVTRAPPQEEPAALRTTAVLVRSRSVLPPLLTELRARGIDYRGVELEGLAERAAVRDLLALTRALLHRGDRTAWLAVLRAPWCGLTLADLHALASADRDSIIAALAADPAVTAKLSGEGRRRLGRVLPALAQGGEDIGRRSLGSAVRSAWTALGGPATVEDPSDLENAETCFAALDALGVETRGLPSAAEVEAAVDGLMASPIGSPEARVQLMTIHRSKGLEFDTVILPGLERRTPAAERQLLYWSPVALESGERGIVLASRSPAGDGRERDALEEWMRHLEEERAEFELGRLAYVAATRARRSLHLVGSVSIAWEGEATPRIRPPERGTLLAFLWPEAEAAFLAAFEAARQAGELRPPAAAARPRRSAPPFAALPADFRLPAAPAPAVLVPARREQPASLPLRPHFDWAGEEAIAAGTMVHAELERLAAAGLPASALPRRPEAWRAGLRRLGLPTASLERALARVDAAVSRMSGSTLAAKLLDPASSEAASELALTAVLDGEIVDVRIDRTFVDADGTRWIVDWKTSSHEGGALEDFLASELGRYAPQLERYSRVMSLCDARPQRVGLYFPLLDAWREISPRRGEP